MKASEVNCARLYELSLPDTSNKSAAPLCHYMEISARRGTEGANRGRLPLSSSQLQLASDPLSVPLYIYIYYVGSPHHCKCGRGCYLADL